MHLLSPTLPIAVMCLSPVKMLITTQVTPLLCNTNQHYAMYERWCLFLCCVVLCPNVLIARSKEELVACLKDMNQRFLSSDVMMKLCDLIETKIRLMILCVPSNIYLAALNIKWSKQKIKVTLLLLSSHCTEGMISCFIAELERWMLCNFLT